MIFDLGFRVPVPRFQPLVQNKVEHAAALSLCAGYGSVGPWRDCVLNILAAYANRDLIWPLIQAMQKIPGIPGALPPLAAYPSREIVTNLSSQEWQACIDSWIFCITVRLRLRDEHFILLQLSQNASGFPFLLSYLRGFAHTSQKNDANGLEANESQLKRYCFFLLRRLLLNTNPHLDCSCRDLFEAVANASILFRHASLWVDTLNMLWRRSSQEMTSAVKRGRKDLLDAFQDLTEPLLIHDLYQATCLIQSSPEVGTIFMTGSDYLEGLVAAYDKVIETEPETYHKSQTILTKHAFICLQSLIFNGSSAVSLLLDHLFFLKAHAENANTGRPTLLSNLIVSTSFVRNLKSYLSLIQQKRGEQLLEWLNEYREQNLHLHPLPLSSQPRSATKGKARAGNDDKTNFHSIEKLSQIKELFPDLTDSYVLELLDNYSDDVEDVTAALLEPDTLPLHLRNTPQSEVETIEGFEARSHQQPSRVVPAAELTSFVPQRRNVFDNDDFDNLRISADRVHMGRKAFRNSERTAEEHAKNKAAIMSALAVFDADDDERDDAYDVADVGGTVDDTVDTDERPASNDEILFGAWNDNPKIFGRDSKTRLSQPRQNLKAKTGMTNEQIEGWAIMVDRDEGLQSRLRQRYGTVSSFRSAQNALASTRWRQNLSGSEENDDSGFEEHVQHAGQAGFSQTRGSRGHTRPGLGGSGPSGSANLESAQAARRKKEQGRGRGGRNHGRREGRARKMGRGMGAVP